MSIATFMMIINVSTTIPTVIIIIIIIVAIIHIVVTIVTITLDVAPGKGGCGHLLSEVGLSSGPSASLLQAASLLLLLTQLGCLQSLHRCQLCGLHLKVTPAKLQARE